MMEQGAALGFSEQPSPAMVLLSAERCRHQPESYAALGLLRVRFRMPSGAWSYVAVPVDALVGRISADPPTHEASAG